MNPRRIRSLGADDVGLPNTRGETIVGSASEAAPAATAADLRRNSRRFSRIPNPFALHCLNADGWNSGPAPAADDESAEAAPPPQSICEKKWLGRGSPRPSPQSNSR